MVDMQQKQKAKRNENAFRPSKNGTGRFSDPFQPFLAPIQKIIPYFTFRRAVTKRESELEINQNFLIASRPCCIDWNTFGNGFQFEFGGKLKIVL